MSTNKGKSRKRAGKGKMESADKFGDDNAPELQSKEDIENISPDFEEGEPGETNTLTGKVLSDDNANAEQEKNLITEQKGKKPTMKKQTKKKIPKKTEEEKISIFPPEEKVSEDVDNQSEQMNEPEKKSRKNTTKTNKKQKKTAEEDNNTPPEEKVSGDDENHSEQMSEPEEKSRKNTTRTNKKQKKTAEEENNTPPEEKVSGDDENHSEQMNEPEEKSRKNTTRTNKKQKKTAEDENKKNRRGKTKEPPAATEEDASNEEQQIEAKDARSSEEDKPPKKKAKAVKKNKKLEEETTEDASENQQQPEPKGENAKASKRKGKVQNPNEEEDDNPPKSKAAKKTQKKAPESKEKPKTSKGKKGTDNPDSNDVTPDEDFEIEKPKSSTKAKASTSKDEPKGPKPPNRSILQLKIVLRYVTPQIWRRIQVLNNDTFFNLHEYIKEAMGWIAPASRHFIAPHPKKKDANVMIVDASLEGMVYDFEKDKHLLKLQNTKLSKFLNYKGDMVLYEFSSESWLHEIIVEKVLPPPGPKAEYPKCTGGQRACPPEECGGVDGFQHLMEVYKDPNHPEYSELIEDWLAEYNPGWDPEKFDKKKIFRRVKMWVYCGP